MTTNAARVARRILGMVNNSKSLLAIDGGDEVDTSFTDFR
jgi:hypothetical protein